MVNIIGISGRKQSGKNTMANYIHGQILQSRDMIKNFNINKDGQLEIETTNINNELGWGIFDVTRKDPEFTLYANDNLWPYVKIYAFADALKNVAINIFGIEAEKVYGNDAQKNLNTYLKWENMPENKEKKTGNMTCREFLEHFGTNIMRKMNDDIWIISAMQAILKENSIIAIIPDVRFPNEVQAIHNHGGKVIRLTRNVYNSEHKCEKALDQDVYDWNNFDLIIDNHNSSIKELCNQLSTHSYLWL